MMDDDADLANYDYASTPGHGALHARLGSRPT
jgi:hypothetical protein